VKKPEPIKDVPKVEVKVDVSPSKKETKPQQQPKEPVEQAVSEGSAPNAECTHSLSKFAGEAMAGVEFDVTTYEGTDINPRILELALNV